MPKDSSKEIKSLIEKAKKNQASLTYALHEKMRELHKYPEKEEKLKDEIHHIQCQMQLKVYEVRLEFYSMIRNIILQLTKKKLLIDFKGARKDTRHMTNFMRYMQHKNIFQLIDRDEFKKMTKTTQDISSYQQTFIKRLINYPMLQNFIIEKFFPSSLEDNINQLHALPIINIRAQSAFQKYTKESFEHLMKIQQNMYTDESKL